MKFRKTYVSLCLAIVLFALSAFALRYRRYVYATAWHCFHSANVKFGTHEVEIPRLWWVEAKDNTNRISIQRADKSSALIETEIEVAPADPDEVADNDADESRLEQAVVSRLSHTPQPGLTYSSISIAARGSIWYCIRNQQMVFGRNFSTGLTCYASRIPYVLHYQGPSEQEGEAKLIFASFR